MMPGKLFEQVEILDAGAEGKAVARINEQVIFVPFVVPGDVADIKLVRKKKSYLEGKATKIHRYSDKRSEPFCEHFGTCGGCRWQNMKYDEQLGYKQKQVTDSIERIGKTPHPPVHPILPAPESTYYRNKLEYTFSTHRWLTPGERTGTERFNDREMNALGFHIPLMFDKVLDIRHCYLQADPSNAIRLEAKRYALDHDLSFYDVRNWKGLMRNLVIRTSLSGEVMVILVFSKDEPGENGRFLDHIRDRFPQVTSLYYVINTKKNDVISDLPFHLYHGSPYLTETMSDFRNEREIEFHIGPASFFQTNTRQAFALYRKAAELAEFRGTETVYDLYTGIGTIAGFISGSVKRVIGIESVAAAVEDAAENAQRNGLKNLSFFPGEAENLLNPGFFEKHGTPEIIITDPPRAGMHEKVVRAILYAAPQKIVYVSCNPATQARDLQLLNEAYRLAACQPVDMFPHTQHVENIALMVRRE